jgi:hypothetical protein
MPLNMMITRENVKTSPMSRLANPTAMLSGTPALTERANMAPKLTNAPPANADKKKANGLFLSISHL